MITPNSLQTSQEVIDLVSAANATFSTGKIKHGPFLLFAPGNVTTYFEFHAPFILNDRGDYDPAAIYQPGDLVTQNGYQFVNLFKDKTNSPPLDENGNPADPVNWRQPWFSCYNRIRAEIGAAANPPTGNGLTLLQQAISGPWPCQNPDINYDELAFYFPDTGNGATVTVVGSVNATAEGKILTVEETESPSSGGPLPQDKGSPVRSNTVDNGDGSTTETDTAITGPPGQYRYRYVTGREFAIVIGGDTPVTLDVTFSVLISGLIGYSITTDAFDNFTQTFDMTDPGTLVQVDTSNWMGGTWEHENNLFDPGGTARNSVTTMSCKFKGTVSPGRYSVIMTAPRSPNNRASGTISITDRSGDTSERSGSNTWAFDTFVGISDIMGCSGTVSFQKSAATPVNGIHDTKQVFKIPVTDFNGLGPPSLLVVDNLYSNNMDGTPLGNAAFGFWPDLIGIDEFAPPVQPAFAKEVINQGTGSVSFATTTDGYWLGKTPPVNALGLLPMDRMPWNLFPKTLQNSNPSSPIDARPNLYLGIQLPYTGGTTFTGSSAEPAYDFLEIPRWIAAPGRPAWEFNEWPLRWKPLTFYPADWTILDSNGNLQRNVFAGWSGGNEPEWGTEQDGLTSEPARAIPGRGSEPGAQWHLKEVLDPTVGRAVARTTPAVYPFFWHNPKSQWLEDTVFEDGSIIVDANGNSQKSSGGNSGDAEPVWNKNLNGATVDGSIIWTVVRLEQPPLVDTNRDPLYPSANHEIEFPFSFLPQGWWVYRVALNRIPQTKSTDKPPTDPIPVKLGCVRNGVFAEFGTYNTGQIIDAMWPVFTSTHLAYECDERLDVQGEILTCGLGYSYWGAVGYPLCATHVNDLMTVLTLL